MPRGRSGAEEELRGTRRETRFGDELEQLDSRERRVLGGLEDAAVSRRKARREFPRGHEQRVIPRDDLPAHADRFAHHHPLDRRIADLVRLPERLGDQPRVVAETPRGIRDVILRLAQRLAVVAGFEFREGAGIFVDEVGQLEKIRRPLLRPHLRPRAFVECVPRVGDREFRIGLPAIGDHCEHLVVRGIENLARRAIARLGPRAVEKHRKRLHMENTFRRNVGPRAWEAN